MQFAYLFTIATVAGLAGLAVPVLAKTYIIKIIGRNKTFEFVALTKRCQPPVKKFQFGNGEIGLNGKRGYQFFVKIDPKCETAVVVAGKIPKHYRFLTKWEQ